MDATLLSLLHGFSVALAPGNLWYAFLGCLVGTLVGVLPGIGPLSGISILLPVTFGLDATQAVIMLAGIYYGSQYGGSTTSILMRIPGEASSVMTCIDGNAMAKKGRAGAALCIAAVGSWVAGSFGVIVLTLVAPPLATLALKFGPPEFTALLVLGMIFLGYMSSSSLVRTLLMACLGLLAGSTLARTLLMAFLGLLLGMVGIDNMTGHFRYSFGFAELGDGIGIVPVAIGLFGLGEILSTPSHKIVGEVIAPKLRELLPNRKEWGEAAMPIARGSVLGFIIGIIPGSAHIISSFLSYALERRISKHPEEFGKGAVAGVAGPESANNAASTGAFVPMLALGIPTGPVPAVLMGALMVHGISPGPQLVTDHRDVFWGFVASMYVGNLMLLLLNLPLVSLFVSVLRIPYSYLYPLIIMFCIVGVYEVNNSIVDVWIMLIMGGIGYALRKFDFDPAPLVLGLVIAPLFEQSLRQSLIMSAGDYMIFFHRPIALSLLVVSIGLLALSATSFLLKRRDWRDELAKAEAGED
jgi:putative tricarboxylic transport membrane protein